MGRRIFKVILGVSCGQHPLSLLGTLSVLGAALLGTALAGSTAGAATLTAQVTAADRAAVDGSSDHHYHLRALRDAPFSPAALSYPALVNASPSKELYARSAAGKAGTTTTTVASGGFYPADMSTGTGPTLASTVSHAVYVNCTNVASCWGNPEGFLQDLGGSGFIHLLDQYIGNTASGRYTDGTSIGLSYSLTRSTTLGWTDLLTILHAAVAKNAGQAGYGHIYHIFLPKGVNVCVASNNCYAPGYPAAFTFCAFHSSVTYADVGHVVFTVEPYQAVAGCQESSPTNAYPNGVVADSTNSTLSHELFEAISNPDGTAWQVVNNLDLYGAEIGDICQNATGIGSLVSINNRSYLVQLEYSNASHSCSATN